MTTSFLITCLVFSVGLVAAVQFQSLHSRLKRNGRIPVEPLATSTPEKEFELFKKFLEGEVCFPKSDFTVSESKAEPALVEELSQERARDDKTIDDLRRIIMALLQKVRQCIAGMQAKGVRADVMAAHGAKFTEVRRLLAQFLEIYDASNPASRRVISNNRLIEEATDGVMRELIPYRQFVDNLNTHYFGPQARLRLPLGHNAFTSYFADHWSGRYEQRHALRNQASAIVCVREDPLSDQLILALGQFFNVYGALMLEENPEDTSLALLGLRDNTDIVLDEEKDAPGAAAVAAESSEDRLRRLNEEKEAEARRARAEEQERKNAEIESQCSICYEPLNNGLPLVTLHGMHRFHKHCLQGATSAALNLNPGAVPNCPLDRVAITRAEWGQVWAGHAHPRNYPV